MSRGSRIIVVLVLLVLLGLVGWGAAAYFRVGVADVPDAIEKVDMSPSTKSNIDQALDLIHKARDAAALMKDYTAVYLRDEHIGGELQKNQILLRIRHEPFSVYMEWTGPRSKVGRKVAYVEGKNNGKMLVKDALPFTVKVDPDSPLAKKESRHVITEAGLKSMIDKFCTRWAKEKELGLTEVLIADGEVRVTLPDGERVRSCVCVTTIHPPQHRQHFLFFRTLAYFDKETGIPVRMQGYDWPADANDKTGLLVEDYTYLDLKPNVGLGDDHFRW